LEKALPNVQVCADLETCALKKHPPATIPPSLLSTSFRSDIVCVDGPNITILELTVSDNSKEVMKQMREQKQQKRPYLEIINNLHRRGFVAKYNTIGISVLSHSI
jgi:hypothetical protein